MRDASRSRLGYISADGVVRASDDNLLPLLNPAATGDVIAEVAEVSASRPCSPVTDDNPAAACQAFGPMASFLSDSDTDEALVRANAAEFGLSAQVWNNDTATISAPCPQPHGRQAWGEHLPVGPPDPFPSAG